MRIAHALQNFVESDCLPKSVPLALLLLINTPKQLEALANEKIQLTSKDQDTGEVSDINSGIYGII